MSVEEMCNWVNERDHYGQGEQIIAALKAGQKMRDEYAHMLRVSTGGRDTDMYTEAWDKATKEDVCGELK